MSRSGCRVLRPKFPAWWAASGPLWEKAAAADAPGAFVEVSALLLHRKVIQDTSAELVQLEETRLRDASEFGQRSYRIVLLLSVVLAAASFVVAGLLSGRGSGVARVLVERLVADARREGFTVVPQCSYVLAQSKRHPEWADVMEE